MNFDTIILTESDEDIKQAAYIIKNGGLVGIPTETVYGLGADATNAVAVNNIFKAKGRPQDNPLIVHISDISMLPLYTQNIPKITYQLAEHFWPGALTVILPKKSIIPDVTSGGLSTIGIRIPNKESTRQLIRQAGVPIAAPSANRSGTPSPTTASHVYDDMNGYIPAIIDGGMCEVGVESTVISFDMHIDNNIRVLRPGGVSVEILQEFCRDTHTVTVDYAVMNKLKLNEVVLSPGVKYKHYSPRANVILVESDSLQKFTHYVSQHINNVNTFFMIYTSDEQIFQSLSANYLTYGTTEAEQAHEVFDRLRELDKKGAEIVYIRCPNKSGVGLAVYNRLLRAAEFEVVKL